MASRGTRVYISAPYSNDPKTGTDAAIDAADALLSRDYVPFVPHLAMYWNDKYPHKYHEWLQYCLEWVPVCDAVLRLPGTSNGADTEVNYAKKNNIPVYYSLDSLCCSEKPTICLGIDPWSTTTNETVSGTRCTEPSSTTRTGWK